MARTAAAAATVRSLCAASSSLSSSYSSLYSAAVAAVAASRRIRRGRGIQTLASNPHIYVHPHPSSPSSSSSSSSSSPAATSILSYLPTLTRATLDLSIGSTSAIPPTPASTAENAHFTAVLREIVSAHAVHDPMIIAQAQQFASTGGGGSGLMFLSPSSSASSSSSASRRRQQRRAVAAVNDEPQQGASGQGGTGGAGVGGWIHVADQRNPPDWGRIPYTEDILGSLQVDGHGRFVGGDGNFQWSGAYRIVTNEGILGLSDYLRLKLVERLRELEKQILESSSSSSSPSSRQ